MTAKEKKDDLLNPFADREYWENETVLQLETEGCLSTHEACNLLEDHPEIVNECWVRNIGPSRTAKRILNAE